MNLFNLVPGLRRAANYSLRIARAGVFTGMRSINRPRQRNATLASGVLVVLSMEGTIDQAMLA